MPPAQGRPPRSPKVALVLAGGAARGAYEVGVAQHLVEDVAAELGRELPLDILCGTSVGAFNVCGLAAFADEPRARGARLAEVWAKLRVDDLIRVDAQGILAVGRDLLRSSVAGRPVVESALLDSKGIERMLAEHIPFPRIDEHLRSGRLDALTVSTTHVRSGRTIVFVHRAAPGLPPWSHDPTITPRASAIRVEHAMASAAIPVLFKPVRIDGEYHCDGGLRQNVPLSPARRLGADGVIVVNPRYIHGEAPVDDGGGAPKPPAAVDDAEAGDGFPGPLFLLGKTLNALLLDRIDTDLARLQGINGILEAGERAYGPGFVDALNRELGFPPGRAMRPLRASLIRASEDIGKMCADFVRSAVFRSRVSGALGRIMRRLAEGDERKEADLLSYLLFDGEFAKQLIELGRNDARARHEELCTFFDAVLRGGPIDPPSTR